MKPVHYLCFTSWGSVFTLSWLIIMGHVPGTGFVTWFFWCFFLLIAFLASVFAGNPINHISEKLL